MSVDDAQASAKERILSAAIELIKRDEGELSSREVARHANVNAALINYHFGDRDGLIQASVDSYYVGVREILTALVPRLADDGFANLVESAVRETLTYLRANRALARLVLLDFVRHGRMRDQSRATEDPLLSLAVDAFSRQLSLSEHEVRFRIKTIILLCGRYVVINDDELARVAGTDDPTEAWNRLESHLVDLARQLFLARD